MTSRVTQKAEPEVWAGMMPVLARNSMSGSCQR
jgi:hypothetical protein